MTNAEIRRIIADGLEAGSCFTLRNKGWKEAFVEGRQDVSFDDIDMDSLAAMELCIAIEVNSGVTILPEDLQHCQSLGALAIAIDSQAT